MAYAVGHISGCHLNPAVSVGLLLGKRFPASELPPYVLAQVLGGIAGAAVLYFIASGQDGFQAGGFASDGFGEHSPGGYSMAAALTAEIVLTFAFLFVILGATDKRAPSALAPVAIGLCLTLIHLIGIPVDNLSVNPARSTATAIGASRLVDAKAEEAPAVRDRSPESSGSGGRGGEASAPFRSRNFMAVRE
jgi:aquaporin Z